jgi:hypothetical protein
MDIWMQSSVVHAAILPSLWDMCDLGALGQLSDDA